MKDEKYYPTRWLRMAAERAFGHDGIGFYMWDRPPHGPKRKIVELLAEDIDESISEGIYTPPVFVLSMEAAQRLMDDLYNCGIRPSDAGESVGALSATKFHLEDTRKLLERIMDEFLERG